MWQRVLFPVLGLVLIAVGIAGCIFPIVPGFPFLLVGVPLIFCFNERWEKRSRKWMSATVNRCKRLYRQLRR